jgi:glutathione peroxidase
MSVYDYIVTNIKDQKISMSMFKGKVLLIVNTATKCGFTPQIKGLEKLQLDYSDQDFEVLGFPCNQFMEQAPENAQKIDEFCRLYYGATFQTFAKVNVKGDAHPLFKYLTSNSPEEITNAETKGFLDKLKELAQKFTGSEIKWNFTKFLIDREGKIVARFNPTVTPAEIAEHIEKLL